MRRALRAISCGVPDCMRWAVERSVRDARRGPQRFRAVRGVERRARVPDDLPRQRDSLSGRRGWVRQAPSQQTKFIGRCQDGAAGERDGSAPPRRPVRIAHRGLEGGGQRTTPLWCGDLRGSEPELRIPRRVHAGGEEPVQGPASEEDAHTQPQGSVCARRARARRSPLLRSSERHGESVPGCA
jgi:hypothetical protein